jgi:hypothetical protein
MTDAPPAVDRDFAAAVGMTRPIPLRVGHAAGGILAEGEIDRPYAVVGSDPECEIALNDPALPRRLAAVLVFGDRVTVFPFDTLVPYPLTPASPWPVGEFTLSRSDAGRPDRGPNPLHADAPAGGPRVSLRVLGDTGTGTWGMTRRVAFVGRSPACTVRLDAAEVSDVHACLLVAADAVWAVDLLSDTGTRVNGEPVRAARLRDGDELTIGRYRIGCRYDLWGAIPDPARPEAADPAPDPTDLVPLAPAAPLAFEPPADTDPTVVALVRSMAAAHGQVLDEFRRSVEEMMAEFGRVQEEQTAAMRRELDRLAELNAELRELYSRPRTPPPSPARALYADPPPEEAATRYQWVAARVAAIETERGGIWDRLRGLFGRGPARA